MNLRTGTTAVIAAALLTGCGGGEDDYANNPRPPAPINVTAAITDRGISVSPTKFGAGPVVFIIANQTDEATKVTLESDTSDGPGIKQTTSPINPDGTATLKVDMKTGDYEVRVDGGDIDATALTVGAARKSAQDELLQP
jgi:hypothetical protein